MQKKSVFVFATILFFIFEWPSFASSMLTVDYNRLVSQADLIYAKPVERSEEGLPLGNGRMGSLIWTEPNALKLQVNRVDVFANNCASNSFPKRHTDYCGGCGFVDIDFGEGVFTETHTKQHLSCYDGLATTEGNGVGVEALAWHERDVMAFKIEDRRENPFPITALLKMLRPPVVKTRNHTATSKVHVQDGKIILTQAFEEGDYFCGSAVVIGMIGRNARTEMEEGHPVRLVADAGQGSFTLLIASAASFDANDDIVATAMAQYEAAAALRYSGLVDSNKSEWHAFWEKSFIHLRSDDGVADLIEKNYTYYLYMMASSSRGLYPVKFNGMLWTTGGDMRQWGGQYWGANQSCLYNALFSTDHWELIDPLFNMYTGMYDSCAVAAKQQWNSQGVFIPETVAFDGLEKLPEEIAAEMSALYLLQKPWEERSASFLELARWKQPHSSRWNWKAPGKWVDGVWQFEERGAGPFAHVTHIFSRGAKIAYQYWLRYEYTQDQTWLRERAYPMLKGVAEFYRHFPNVKKESDGLYHINHVNSNEPLWGGRDTDEEISAMRGIFPVAIKASEILHVDEDLRPVWRDFLEHLAPLPQRPGEPVWIKGLEPIAKGRGTSLPDQNTMPMWFFDLCTLEVKDPETRKIANATFDACFRNGINQNTRIGVLSKLAGAAAVLGRADDVKVLIPNQIQTQESPILANRMTLREGAQTPNLQHIGRAADALTMALCQSVPPAPGEDPVIHVFSAWPKEWDAAFQLLARGAFTVGSSMRNGEIEFVEIQANAGGECRLRNPWGNEAVRLYRQSEKVEAMEGSLLTFPMKKDEEIVIVRGELQPEQFKSVVPFYGM